MASPAPRRPPPVTAADADALELATGLRHEFYNGRAVAMSGGTLRHNAIAINVALALRSGLVGKPCRAYIADVKLKVVCDGAHFYPDAIVVCGDRAGPADGRVALTDATVVIEVESQSTSERNLGRELGAQT